MRGRGPTPSCLALVLVMAPFLAACYEQVILPCYQTSEVGERILEIRRITNSASGAPVSTAMFSDFIVNGHEFFADGAARTGGGSGAEVVSPSTIRCSTPCKFGTEPYRYGFLVSADGFKSKRVEFPADWMNKEESGDGCQVVVSGATVVEIVLDPQT